tara:strand:- start:8951 stop:9517 length:567 start_codon:yes stop_codon:yes gene_type:complete
MKHDKSFLRRRSLILRRKNYSNIKRFDFSLIFKLIKKHFSKKKIIIAGYYPSDSEVDVMKFIEEALEKKFKIVLPVVKNEKNICFYSWASNEPLYVNRYGILEPKKKRKETVPDLIMVPLVAFDKNLNRIGYGKGYYDRSLKKIRKIKKKAIYLGIAYSFQRCKLIPVNQHDFKLDYIFTERGIISSN